MVTSIKRNAETCPLLKLPLELKRKIYTDVLGGRRILIRLNETKGIYGDAPHNFTSLLATSRQLYVEANLTFWSTNSFAFGHHLAFGAWMKKRNKAEKVALRSLGFVMDLTTYSQLWLKSLSERVIKQLPNLVNLHLGIYRFIFGSDYGSEYDFGDIPDSPHDVYIQDSNLAPVRNLAKVPLANVEVDMLLEYPWKFLTGDV